MLDVCGAAVRVDVVSVRFIVDDIGLRTERFEYALRDLPGSSIGHIKTDSHALESVFAHADEMADVTVPAIDIVDGPADLFAACRRDVQLPVDVIFDLEDRILIHLLTIAVQQLDAIVVIRVVRCGDHDPAVELIDPRDIRDGRRRGDVHDIGVGPTCHKACAERILEHVARSSGVLADQHLGLLALVRTVVPSEKPSNADRMLEVQCYIRFTAESICSEIFTHRSICPPCV